MDDLSRIHDAARSTATSYSTDGHPHSDLLATAFDKFADFIEVARRQKILEASMRTHYHD